MRLIERKPLLAYTTLMKQTKKLLKQQNQLRLILVGTLCMLTAFTVGLQSNTSITATLNAADTPVQSGDINADDIVDISDVIWILEAQQGYRTVNPQTLKADPDKDGKLTIDDALLILRQLQ